MTVDHDPSDGKVTIDENGIVQYEPTPGFQGQDSFITNTCPLDGGDCVLVTINVHVVILQDIETESKTGEKSFPYAVLSVLVVIPIFVIGYLVYCKKSFAESSQKHTLPPGSMWSGARSEQPGIPHQDETAAELLHEPGHDDGGYMPVNKDQARSFAIGPPAEVSGIAMSPGPNNNNDRSNRADPPDVASANAVPDMTTNNYLPERKDQCREVAAERQSNDPPLAQAIFIKPEAVMGPLNIIVEE